jgi:hypothetical protein
MGKYYYVLKINIILSSSRSVVVALGTPMRSSQWDSEQGVRRLAPRLSPSAMGQDDELLLPFPRGKNYNSIIWFAPILWWWGCERLAPCPICPGTNRRISPLISHGNSYFEKYIIFFPFCRIGNANVRVFSPMGFGIKRLAPQPICKCGAKRWNTLPISTGKIYFENIISFPLHSVGNGNARAPSPMRLFNVSGRNAWPLSPFAMGQKDDRILPAPIGNGVGAAAPTRTTSWWEIGWLFPSIDNDPHGRPHGMGFGAKRLAPQPIFTLSYIRISQISSIRVSYRKFLRASYRKRIVGA